MNNIFELFNDGGYYIHMIVHGRYYHSRNEWSAQTLTEKPVYNYHWPFYKWAYTLLDSPNDLTSYIKRIVDLPNGSIYEVIQSIPIEQKVREIDKYSLYQVLLNQEKNLPEIVNNIIQQHSGVKRQPL